MYFIHHTVGSTMQQQSAPEQMPPSGGPPMGNKFSLRKGKGECLEVFQCKYFFKKPIIKQLYNIHE